MKKRRRIWKKT